MSSPYYPSKDNENSKIANDGSNLIEEDVVQDEDETTIEPFESIFFDSQ